MINFAHLLGGLNICPTLEQTAVATAPPHIHSLQESSRFSPPVSVMPSSRAPMRRNDSLFMAKTLPLITGLAIDLGVEF